MNGFQEEYSPNIVFEQLNAADGDAGQSAFTALGLRGHPAVVIFNAAGEEIYRTLGLVEEEPIREVLQGL